MGISEKRRLQEVDVAKPQASHTASRACWGSTKEFLISFATCGVRAEAIQVPDGPQIDLPVDNGRSRIGVLAEIGGMQHLPVARTADDSELAFFAQQINLSIAGHMRAVILADGLEAALPERL